MNGRRGAKDGYVMAKADYRGEIFSSGQRVSIPRDFALFLYTARANAAIFVSGRSIRFLKQFDEFQTYTEEEMQQDLEQLVKWKNLIARQETGHIRTIEEFKKKRFRYQCSPYTVEIERMIRTLEQLGETFGGSLEKTRFDRLYASLVRMESIIDNGFGENEKK